MLYARPMSRAVQLVITKSWKQSFLYLCILYFSSHWSPPHTFILLTSCSVIFISKVVLLTHVFFFFQMMLVYFIFFSAVFISPPEACLQWRYRFLLNSLRARYFNFFTPPQGILLKYSKARGFFFPVVLLYKWPTLYSFHICVLSMWTVTFCLVLFVPLFRTPSAHWSEWQLQNENVDSEYSPPVIYVVPTPAEQFLSRRASC